ncbi:MAG: DUF4446 family protein [Actinobacteria bacterium]|nr:MAG: DUF4446 family protein [Actinomycetota bacterium]
MTLDPNVLSIVAVAAAGVAVIALAFALRSTTRVRKLRRALRVIQASTGSEVTVEDAEDVVRSLAGLAKRVDDLEVVARLAVQHVGLVRFDAFEDMGGHLSFAAAMLDAEANGFVLTSINGRQETRIYAKPIERGASQYHLSEEEQEAIRRAISSRYRSS